jgi:hypothetical protein
MEGKDTRIEHLRQLLASIHSAAEAATDIDECISNAEMHANTLSDHLCKVIEKTDKQKRKCLGTCINCGWPLYQTGNYQLMHFELAYELGNKCYLPKLGGHNGS